MPGTVIPSLPTHNDDDDEDSGEKVEDIPLILPSALEPRQRLAICRYRVAEHEQQFRLAQLEDSLIELRRVRRIRRTLIVNHKIQIAGQGRRPNTRSHSMIDSIEERIAKFTRRYRAARRALLQLDPSGNWQDTYLELKDCDNRGPGKEQEEQRLGDGTYTTSWIWLANPRACNPSGAMDPDEDATDEEVNDAMRVEWATSFARLERWTEEIELLQEEMRRVVAFLEWKAVDWLAKREARSALVTPDIQSGLDAYARKQAAVYRGLAVSFSVLWRPTLVSHKLKYSWATEYLQLHNISLDDTPATRNRRISKSKAPSNTEHDQPVTPQGSQALDPPMVHGVGKGTLLDEADSDSSTDSASSDTEYGDDSDFDFDFDFAFDFD